jgi:hypothetical protein
MRRLAGALVVVAAPLAISVPLVLSWRDRLPAQLASHWGLSQDPDGFTGRDAFLDGWTVAAVIAVVLCVGIALAMRRGRRIAVTVMGATTGFLAALGLMMTVPNLDVTDPRTAEIGWAAAIPLPLMVTVAVLAWWIHGPRDEPALVADAPPAADLPRLAPGAAPEYDEVQTSWPMAAFVLIVLGGLGVVLSIAATPWLGVELIVLALALASMARARVRVSSAEDLLLSSGPIKHRIPIAEVLGASTRPEVDPFGEFGGWSLRYRPRAVGLVMKKGPGVDVSRTDDRRVVITCPDPERLAAVINTLADERFARAAT